MAYLLRDNYEFDSRREYQKSTTNKRCFLFLEIGDRAGKSEPINIIINFVINMGISLFLTLVSAKTITPLTNYICNKIKTSFLKVKSVKNKKIVV